MNTILVTGATGFIGSALAANLLARGARVVALSRNDASGERTRSAIRSAADGFHLPWSDEIRDRIRVIPVDFSRLESHLAGEDLSQVGVAWNCAAEMSYSSLRLLDSIHQNVTVTNTLLRLLEKHAPGCRRFYQISTAYTAGVNGGRILEALHYTPVLKNCYQVTKWASEQSLANLHRSSRIPVTIFRPSIVIGHGRTGWAAGKGFGLYMFVDVMHAAARDGAEGIMLDVPPDSHPNFIPIDVVVKRAVALGLREDQGRDLEIFNCVSDSGPSATELCQLMGECVRVPVRVGRPITRFDHRVNAGIANNKIFAVTTYQFETSKIAAALGPDYEPVTLGPECIRRTLREYVARVMRASPPPAQPVPAGVADALDGAAPLPGVRGTSEAS